MRELVDEGVVVHDTLSFREFTAKGLLTSVNVAGRISCANGVIVDVDKWLDARRRPDGRYEVKGYSYSYNASLSDGTQLLRYDSAHGLNRLHKHTYDKRGRGTEEAIALDDLPTLDLVVREAVARASELT